MHKSFISLERTPQRTERFRQVNAHVADIALQPGIDGARLDMDEVREKA